MTSLTKIQAFNWEKLLAKISDAEVKRSVNRLRGKANDMVASSAKVTGAAPIDFGAYKNKLKFTSAAVDALEKTYNSRVLPKYTADLPALEAKKREALMDVVRSSVEIAKQELQDLQAELVVCNSNRITRETSVGELRTRFPAIAKKVEEDIKNHEWVKESL